MNTQQEPRGESQSLDLIVGTPVQKRHSFTRTLFNAFDVLATHIMDSVFYFTSWFLIAVLKTAVHTSIALSINWLFFHCSTSYFQGFLHGGTVCLFFGELCIELLNPVKRKINIVHCV